MLTCFIPAQAAKDIAREVIGAPDVTLLCKTKMVSESLQRDWFTTLSSVRSRRSSPVLHRPLEGHAALLADFAEHHLQQLFDIAQDVLPAAVQAALVTANTAAEACETAQQAIRDFVHSLQDASADPGALAKLTARRDAHQAALRNAHGHLQDQYLKHHDAIHTTRHALDVFANTTAGVNLPDAAPLQGTLAAVLAEYKDWKRRVTSVPPALIQETERAAAYLLQQYTLALQPNGQRDAKVEDCMFALLRALREEGAWRPPANDFPYERLLQAFWHVHGTANQAVQAADTLDARVKALGLLVQRLDGIGQTPHLHALQKELADRKLAVENADIVLKTTEVRLKHRRVSQKEFAAARAGLVAAENSLTTLVQKLVGLGTIMLCLSQL